MEVGIQEPEVYKAYKRRYLVMFTVVMLNISNAALWITYSPVATIVTNFYQIGTTQVNMFSTVYLIITVPFTFISTYIIDTFGLKFAVYLGASLNCGGAIVKAFGTSAVFDPAGAAFAVSLTGQVFCASSQSFLLFIPTKVSQTWFPENQRGVSTTILAMSNPLGIVIAEVVTAFIVYDPEDVPTINYVWMGVALFSLLLTVVFIRSAGPPTPASASAEKSKEDRPPYLTQLKDTFTCVPYLLLLFTLGGGIGLFNGVATLAQQLLCSLGYSDKLGALAVVLLILFGFAGSAVTGILGDKTKKFTEITKISFGCATFFAIFMLEFLMFPNMPAGVLIFSALFGFFGMGAYPIGLELAVETTYPVEETISTAFIFLSGQVHGVLIIILTPILAQEQALSQQHLNTCDVEVDPELKDYTVPLLVIMTYFTLVVSTMIAIFKTDYKRQQAEIDKSKKIAGPSSSGSIEMDDSSFSVDTKSLT